MKHDLKNIILVYKFYEQEGPLVVCHFRNRFLPKNRKVEVSDIIVDCSTGKWSYGKYAPKHDIGGGFEVDDEGQFIGVYDCTNDTHLTTMANAIVSYAKIPAHQTS
jgi:hypothetical protein